MSARGNATRSRFAKFLNHESRRLISRQHKTDQEGDKEKARTPYGQEVLLISDPKETGINTFSWGTIRNTVYSSQQQIDDCYRIAGFEASWTRRRVAALAWLTIIGRPTGSTTFVAMMVASLDVLFCDQEMAVCTSCGFSRGSELLSAQWVPNAERRRGRPSE